MVKDDCIAFFLSKGFTLTPLNGKIPLVKKWQKTEYDPLFDTEGNYGVVLQDEDVVVDIDPRNGGSIPPFLQNVATLTIKTGGGGWHYYFKKDPSKAIVGLLKAYPGVEFKTKGNQVVGPGSKTTGEYEIINNAPIIECPFIDFIVRRADTLAKKTDKKVNWTDDPQTQERFIKYLSNCPVAVQGQNGDATTFQVACHARDLGLDEQTATKLMVIHYNPRCLPPWPQEEISIKVNNAYKYAQNDAGTLNPAADFDPVAIQDGVTGWEHDKAGKIKPTFRNTLNVLLLANTEISGLFKFNEFSEDITFAKESPWHKSSKDSRNWTDADAVLLKEWISVHYNFAPAVSDIHEAVLAVSKRASFHPVKDYLQGIKWDGTPRTSKWLVDYMGVEDNAYVREVSEKILCAAVHRVFNPGEPFHQIMVLEGGQGIGKSRACKALGGKWYTDAHLDPHNKDFIDIIRDKWLVEIAEMDSANRAESNAIKAFLSKDTDRCRLAYARATKDFQRQCIFIGTYNPVDGESAYLKDPTGYRRYWPIKIPKAVNVDGIIADRDQLWAEAVVKSKGCKLYLESVEAIEIQKKETEGRQERDPWHEVIQPWALANIREGNIVSCLTLFTHAIGGKSENYSVMDGRRLANVMRGMKWQKTFVWDADKQNSVSGYKRPFLTKSETRVLTDPSSSDIL